MHRESERVRQENVGRNEGEEAKWQSGHHLSVRPSARPSILHEDWVCEKSDLAPELTYSYMHITPAGPAKLLNQRPRLSIRICGFATCASHVTSANRRTYLDSTQHTILMASSELLYAA